GGWLRDCPWRTAPASQAYRYLECKNDGCARTAMDRGRIRRRQVSAALDIACPPIENRRNRPELQRNRSLIAGSREHSPHRGSRYAQNGCRLAVQSLPDPRLGEAVLLECELLRDPALHEAVLQ